MPSVHSFFRVAAALMGLTVGSLAIGQVTVSVSGSTGWNPWIKADGTWMADAAADQQTGQGADDFVGSATVAGFQQNAGLLGGVDSYVFRARMDKYDSKGFRGNWINGMDLDGDGDLDLFMKLSDTSGGTTLSFALPGTGLNISPNTTSIVTPWQGSISLTASTYDYQQVTTGQFNATPDGYVSFGISFANLQTAIQTYAGGAFSTFQINYGTRISFIASTSTQGNALNQDLYGATGSLSSPLTWGELGVSTGFTTPLGIIPEPATYLQMGVLLMTAGIVVWRQRRRSAAGPVAATGDSRL